MGVHLVYSTVFFQLSRLFYISISLSVLTSRLTMSKAKKRPMLDSDSNESDSDSEEVCRESVQLKN